MTRPTTPGESPNGEPVGSSARLRVLAEVSRAFATDVSNHERLVETIVRAAADLVGDGCQIFLVSDDGLSLINAGNAHRDAAIESDIRNFLALAPQSLATSQMVSAGVVRSGEPKLIPEIEPDAAVAETDAAVMPLLARVRIYSAAIVPIRARGAVIGAMSMIRTRPGCGYASNDLTLLEDIADRAGLAIENARLYGDLERRVRERTVELEAANRELDAFSRMVSHDLRAPLRHIDGFSRLLVERCADRLGDEGRGYVERLRARAERMAAIIDDLLKLSRVERAQFQRARVDVTKLAREVVKGLRAAGRNRVAEVHVADGLAADADGRLLAILLENVIGNAWKFTEKTAEPRIEVGETLRDGRMFFFVRDNGAGFDGAQAHRMFKEFQRLHTETEFAGTGIGLAIVERIVSRHGGGVWAEGAVGTGATIYFSLSPPC
ncbi:MAG: GAF domain-containing protein [Deltaproteobacteria bacterium]|nr:GAF domain-containing protein [Deltaproteobacteria bacterium]